MPPLTPYELNQLTTEITKVLQIATVAPMNMTLWRYEIKDNLNGLRNVKKVYAFKLGNNNHCRQLYRKIIFNVEQTKNIEKALEGTVGCLFCCIYD